MGRWMCVLLLAVCCSLVVGQGDAELDQMLVELQSPSEDEIQVPYEDDDEDDEMHDIYRRSAEDELNALAAPDSEDEIQVPYDDEDELHDMKRRSAEDELNALSAPDSETDMSKKKRFMDQVFYDLMRTLEDNNNNTTTTTTTTTATTTNKPDIDLKKRSVEEDLYNFLRALEDNTTDTDVKKRSVGDDLYDFMGTQEDMSDMDLKHSPESDIDVKKRSPESDMDVKKRSPESDMDVQKRSAETETERRFAEASINILEDINLEKRSPVEVVSVPLIIDEPETDPNSNAPIDNEVSASIKVVDDETPKEVTEIEVNSAYVEVLEDSDDGLAEAETGNIKIEDPNSTGHIALDEAIATSDIRVDEPAKLIQPIAIQPIAIQPIATNDKVSEPIASHDVEISAPIATDRFKIIEPIATHAINIQPIEYVEAKSLKSEPKIETEIPEDKPVIQPATIELHVSKQVPAIGIPPRRPRVSSTSLSRDPVMLALLATIVIVSLILSLFICFVTVNRSSPRRQIIA